MKKAVATVVVALGLVGASSGTAFAGERGGNGAQTPITNTANSECAFSGLDDMDFLSPVQPGVVQNWGVIPKEVRDEIAGFGAHPGNACNGHKFPSRGAPTPE